MLTDSCWCIGPVFQRYEDLSQSSLSSIDLNRLYVQDVQITERARAPCDEKKTDQILLSARVLARLYRPTLRKTVRDWHRGTQGYGPSLILQRGLNTERGPGLGSAALSTQLDMNNGSPPPPPDSMLFQRGDVLAVLTEPDYVSFADEFNPWMLLRCSQPHDHTKTQPRCHVKGHVLYLTEDAHVYQQNQEKVQYVYFKDLILDEQGDPIILHVGTELTFMPHGEQELLFELDSEVADEIMDAVDRLQYDVPQDLVEESDEGDAELEHADSELRRQRILEERAERRTDFIARSNLQRSSRLREPSRSLRESLLCGKHT